MQTERKYTQRVTVGMLASRRTVVVHHTQKVTEPMTYSERLDIYRGQNFQHRTELTQRQVRQLDRMQNRAFFRTGNWAA